MQGRRASRLILQLALAVMLLGALAPTVARALAAARAASGPGLDVCSTQTAPARKLAITAAPALAPALLPEGHGHLPSLDHCPFCLLVAERLGPPPAASVHFFNADSGLAWPDAQALFFPAPLSAHAQARGPPDRS